MNSLYLSLISFALIIASSFGGGPAMPSCKLSCTKIYFPICASDGEVLKTFNNQCELEKFNCVNNKGNKRGIYCKIYYRASYFDSSYLQYAEFLRHFF